jgi:hypothetical protein
MKEVGLMPSKTGEPGGAETGQQMSHYIMDGGQFKKSCKKLLDDGFKISWGSSLFPKSKKRKDIKYMCRDCKNSFWGKPNMPIICGRCFINFINIIPRKRMRDETK